MNKLLYTVIYTERWMSGSHWHSVVKFERCQKLSASETVQEMLERLNLQDYANYVFEGHPKLEGEQL